MSKIDLNADLGEGESTDAELLSIVTSCNIACGGHAGNESSMRDTIVMALQAGVAIGAHPSYPDAQGFGRRSGFLAGEALYESLTAQVTIFSDIACELGATMTHIKPHGALYNDAAADPALADILARVCDEAHGHVVLVGPPASALQAAASSHGIGFVAEGFIDRLYTDTGGLVPRARKDAVHSGIDRIASQALSIAADHNVISESGDCIPLVAQTLCIHGDTPGAVDAARTVRRILESNGIEVGAVDGSGQCC